MATLTTYKDLYNKAQTNANTIYNNTKQNLDTNLARNQQAQNQAYNTAQSNAYIAYRKAQNRQNELASNSGMTGGAVESLAVGDANQYNQNVSNLNAGKLNAMNNLQNSYNTALMEAQNAKNDAISNATQNYGQAQIQYDYQKAQDAQNRKDTINQNALNVFAQTVSRYNTIAKCNTALNNLSAQRKKASSADRWYYDNLISIVQAQKNAIRR